MFWMVPVWIMPMEQQPLQIFTPDNQEGENIQPLQAESENPQRNPRENAYENKIFLKIFHKLLRKKYKKPQKKAWNQEQDSMLIKLREQGLDWEQIAEKLSIGNWTNCERRFCRLKKTERKWPKKVDELIKQLTEKKKMKWREIGKFISKGFNGKHEYTGKMVRERYKNYLRAGIEKKPWSFEDDLKLVDLVMKEGTTWSRFTESLSGKTELELKNRFHGILEPLIKKALRIHQRQPREDELVPEE